MAKTLTYDFDDVVFEYDVDYEDVYSFIEDKFAKDYGLKINVARDIIDDLNLYETLEEYYEEDIIDNWFEDANESYKDYKEYKSDPYYYHGVSEKDFY